ncbi:hypothetical protein ACB094_05G044200 [Castanea mollissima]
MSPRKCNIIVAMTQKIPLPYSVEEVEALAASAAIQFAKDLCIHKIELKGDSLLDISALRDSRASFTLYVIAAKRIWSIVRVAFFILRKCISKRKLMLDLNMLMKRGKIAGKAISNLMFHHHHHRPDRRMSLSAPREYEFSCSNTPNYALHINNKRRHHHSHFFAGTHAPATLDDDVATVNAVKAMVLEMLNNEAVVEASPAIPGFGRSPMVRQLRITDSPFPLRDIDEDSHVDEAAEEFIQRFYKELRQQN